MRSWALTTVAKHAVAAMHHAGREYHGITGGWAPWSAPESFLRDAVARRLHGQMNVSVSLELTRRQLTRHAAEAETRGGVPRKAKQGRVDVCVWSSRYTPRVLIEIKRGWDIGAIEHDVRRLRSLCKRRYSVHALIATVGTDLTCDRATAHINRLATELDLKPVKFESYYADWNDRYWPARYVTPVVFAIPRR